MHRRNVLQLVAGSSVWAAGSALLTPVLGREPITRIGPPRFQIGLAAYSLRDYFRFMKGKPRTPKDDGPAIDMVGFLDYCVKHQFDTAELTSYFFPPAADDYYFRQLKQAAFIRGMTISGTAIGNNFTVGAGPELDHEIDDAKRWIDRAAILGAPHIRIFVGTGAQLNGYPERMDQAISAVETCAAHASRAGIFLGIENHGKLTADQMIEVIQRVDSQWVGINLDTGNFVSDDPYADLQRCLPYAVNVQVKASMKSPAGDKYPADLERIAKLLKASNYQGFVVLEYEDDDPYKMIPTFAKQLSAALAM